MKSRISLFRKKGFTLIELLVVITIIVGLAGIAFSVVMSQVDKARRTQSQKECSDIAGAIENFFIENSTLPVLDMPAQDSVVTTADDDPSELITILLAREKGPDRTKVNKTNKKYLGGATVPTKMGGIYVDASGAGFYDMWGNPYFVIMDFDGNDEIDDPSTPGGVIMQKKAIVYGMGPDGMGSHADNKIRDKEANADNVYSWKANTNK